MNNTLKYIATGLIGLSTLDYQAIPAVPKKIVAAVTPAAKTATLTIKVTGFRTDKGNAGFALYNSKAGFDKDKGFREELARISNRTATITLRDIPVGVYAAAANLTGDAIEPLIARMNLITEGSGLAPLTLPPAAPPPRLLTGGSGQSLENLLHNRFNTLRVGITINLPLRNTTAKAELGRALVEAEKLQTEQRQLTQSIHVEVRNALQEMRSAEAKVNAAETSRAAAAKSWESERRKLDAGHATASVNL